MVSADEVLPPEVLRDAVRFRSRIPGPRRDVPSPHSAHPRVSSEDPASRSRQLSSPARSRHAHRPSVPITPPLPPTQIAAVEERRVVGLGRAGDDAHASSRNERLSDTDILIEDVFGYPAPGSLHPIDFQWSPDGALLGNLFSPNGTLVRDLYAYDVRAGAQRLLATPAREAYADEARLPDEEKLRRERTRELGLGVTRFEWASRRAKGEARRLLVPQSDGAYVLDVVDDDAPRVDGDTAVLGVDTDTAGGDKNTAGGDKLAASEPRLVVDSGDNGAAILDAKLSPDGKWVAFVREKEIRVAPCDPLDGDDRDEATDRDVVSDALPSARVTFGAYGRDATTHGLAEFIAAEEMDRSEGYWWSPDGRKIAFARVDAGTVTPYRIERADGSSERHRYPFAGGTNARVTLGVVDVSPLVDAATDAANDSPDASRRGDGILSRIFGRGERAPRDGRDRFFSRENPLDFDVVWLDVDCGPGNARGDEEEYLARVAWSADSERVFAQVQRRDQRSASLIRVDARTGERCDPAPLVIEYPPAGCGWVNLAPPSATFRELRGEIADPSGVIRAGDFLWGSWRTGHLHLYVHCGSTGVCKRAVSAGDWSVDELIGVDELSGHVYFTGTADGPLEKHLYRAPLWGPSADDGSCTSASMARLTPRAGWNLCSMDEACTRFVCVHSAADKTPTVTVHETKATATTTTVEFGDERAACSSKVPFLSPLLGERFRRLAPPTPFEVTAADGATKLHGVAYVPDERVHGPPPYPCVVSVYGGPHAQTVQNAWHLTTDIRAQSYRSRGICVLKLDNRGSARRGQRFERAICGNLGAVEVEDQARGVDHLVRCGVVDPTRVGIFGWSYGGFLAATALARRPDVFACAVAGAPVTAWEWYDAHYTERYMGTPDANPDGYANASVIGRCGDVRGKVLVVHGVVDENVHFRHSTAYVAGLERCGKTAGDGYVFMPFPNEQHVPRGATDMMYMERSMQAFFEANLLQVDGGRRGAKSEDGDGMPVTNTAPA